MPASQVVPFADEGKASHLPAWNVDPASSTPEETAQSGTLLPFRQRAGSDGGRLDGARSHPKKCETSSPRLTSIQRLGALGRMAEVDRRGPQGEYNYYVLALRDSGLATAQPLQKLHESHRRETILAVR